MTLQEIKDQVAQARGYENWIDLIKWHDPGTVSETVADEVIIRYAKAYAEADRKDCAEKTADWFYDQGIYGYGVGVKSSILNRPLPKMI